MSVVNIDITSVNTDAQYAVGQIYRNDAIGKTYKYVKYDKLDSLDLVAGDCVSYVDDTGYAASTVTADSSAATGKNIGAGVSAGTVTADNQYFWIQIKGAATLNVNVGGSLSDGDPLTAEAAPDKSLTLALEVDSGGDYVFVCAVSVDDTADEIICMFPE